MVQLFDAHCHLASSQLDHDRDHVLKRAYDAGVTHFAVCGYEIDEWAKLRAFKESNIVCAIGLHPWWVHETSDEKISSALNELDKQMNEHKFYAIGETGLDKTHGRDSSLEKQIQVFRTHIEIAKKKDLPLVLHIVQAHEQALKTLETMKPLRGGMVHSFSGSVEIAMQYIKLGLSISLSGLIAKPQAHKLLKVAKMIPINSLLVESDAPSQAPYGMNDQRNEPAYLAHTVKRLAEIRNTSFEEIANQTYQNACQLFRVA